MKLFDILKFKLPNFKADECKLHIAGWNGSENPLDLYFAGEFEEWQSWQSKKNFERKYIISIIQLPAKDKWLFAGIYQSYNCYYDKSKEYFKVWAEYYEKLKMEIPEGQLGCNPGGISTSDKLKIIGTIQ